MKHYKYLIIGGGLAGDAATRGIRELDAEGSIGLISMEPDPPYMRPNLSKGLWKGRPVEKIWRIAAGRGERLRPFTLKTPKPLLPIRGKPLIAWTLDALARQRRALGLDAVAINLHHLGDQVRAAIGETYGGLPIRYSDERTQLLGTLGALFPLRRFLGEAQRFLIVNGDSLCDWPLERLLTAHENGGERVATLLLAAGADPSEFGGGVGVDRRGRVVAFGRSADPRIVARRVFAGAHVLERDLLARVPAGPADTISHLYEPLLAAGAVIGTVSTTRRWHDLGTPERCRAAGLVWPPAT